MEKPNSDDRRPPFVVPWGPRPSSPHRLLLLLATLHQLPLLHLMVRGLWLLLRWDQRASSAALRILPTVLPCNPTSLFEWTLTSFRRGMFFSNLMLSPTSSSHNPLTRLALVTLWRTSDSFHPHLHHQMLSLLLLTEHHHFTLHRQSLVFLINHL